MIRSTVVAAVLVWSVPNTKWPVSAVSIAISMVSRSRISPTRTISGSSRKAARKRACKTLGMNMHFALVYQAAHGAVPEFDRIFDGDQVLATGPVDQVDHGGQGGRFSAAGGSGHNDEPLGQETERANALGNVEFFKRGNAGRNLAHYAAYALVIHKDIYTEARCSGEFIGKVGVPLGLQLLNVAFRRKLIEEVPELFFGKFFSTALKMHFTIDSETGLMVCGQVNITCTLFQHFFQQFIDFIHKDPQITQNI